MALTRTAAAVFFKRVQICCFSILTLLFRRSFSWGRERSVVPGHVIPVTGPVIFVTNVRGRGMHASFIRDGHSVGMNVVASPTRHPVETAQVTNMRIERMLARGR